MCSSCAGHYEDPDVTIYVDDEPEPECPHTQVSWDGYRSLFKCKSCGAQIVNTELAEALGLTPTE
jgi:hypothetical protein